MSRRRRITIEDHGRRSVVVRGWRAGPLLAEAGVKGVFSGAVSGWLVDQRHLADLVAILERRNIAVELTTLTTDEGDPDGGAA